MRGGTIPYSIKLNFTRKDVKEKLGASDKIEGGSNRAFRSYWERKGLQIRYKTDDQKDMTNRVDAITLVKIK